MGFERLRKLELLLSVAMLLALLVPYLVGALGPWPMAVALVAVAVWWLRPKLKRLARADAPSRELSEVKVGSPSERYVDLSPIPYRTLHALLTSAELGEVALADGALRVTGRSGQIVELRAQRPEAVVRSQLRMRTNSFHWAALCADAIAPRVGPLRLESDGMALDIDGTQPRSDLEHAVHDQQMNRMRRVRAELDALN
jgi:hypothetical protein